MEAPLLSWLSGIKLQGKAMVWTALICQKKPFTNRNWPFQILGNTRQIWINAPQRPRQCVEGFFHPHAYLGRRLQAVLQVFAWRIISKKSESRQLRLPHADPLVQRIQELFHCGGAVETHHLRGKTRGNTCHSRWWKTAEKKDTADVIWVSELQGQ